jgi:hypothetical protein
LTLSSCCCRHIDWVFDLDWKITEYKQCGDVNYEWRRHLSRYNTLIHLFQ